MELDSMDLYRPQSKKPSSFWISDEHHKLRDSKTNAGKFSQYPAISKLREMVNKDQSVIKSDLDCCNIICYSNARKTLRLHSDNDHYISQLHPIVTFSLGASRPVEFVPHGASHTHVVKSITVESNSIYIMHPGCQGVLQHRVLPGNNESDNDQLRFSISFRKYKNDDTNTIPVTTSNPSLATVPTQKVSLLAGDSFLARLDAFRLGKEKKTVFNIAKGGNKIPDTIDSLRRFSSDTKNDIYLVEQVFVSVGTNDIRNCADGRVNNFKGELFKLVRYIKDTFPRAKIFFQSLLPLPVTHYNRRYVIRNILDFNRLIFHVCSHERVFMLDVFRSFLFKGFRNPWLFPNNVNDIHPNNKGLGVLAKFYIDRIHSRFFDPFSHN